MAWLNLNVMVGSVFLLPGITLSGQEDDKEWFPPRIFHEDQQRDQIKREWFTKQLRAMREDPLWDQADPNSNTTTYRLLWLPTFHRPAMVKITVEGRDACLRAVELDGRGGFDPGDVRFQEQKKLSEKETQQLSQVFKSAKFWDLPTDSPDNAGVADAAMLVLEVLHNDTYHVVCRISREKTHFSEVCRQMLELSSIDYVEVWEGYHYKIKRKLTSSSDLSYLTTK